MFGTIFNGAGQGSVGVGLLSFAAAEGPRLVAVAAAALAVKLMDDVLDAPRDRVRGYPNWSSALGRATTPYALLCLGLGAAAHGRVAVSLFLAAYAWGMVGDSSDTMPSGLKGWQESALAAAVSLAAAGLALTAAAMALVGAAHLADDWLDRPAGAAGPGYGGDAAPPGLLPVLAMVLALSSLLLDPWLFVWGALSAGAIILVTRPRPGSTDRGASSGQLGGRGGGAS